MVSRMSLSVAPLLVPFLGSYSPQHARSVLLVFSLTSGLTSPQFNVKDDNSFQTLRHSFGNSPPEPKWQEVWGFVQPQRPTTKPEVQPKPRKTTDPSSANDKDTRPAAMPPTEGGTSDGQPLGSVTDPNTGLRQSAQFLRYMEDRDPQFVAYLERDALGDMHPQFAFQAKINKNANHFYWHQAMKQLDAKEFQKAVLKEITNHTKNSLFKLVAKSTIPKGTLIAPEFGPCYASAESTQGKSTSEKQN